jgi:hypothetical protein
MKVSEQLGIKPGANTSGITEHRQTGNYTAVLAEQKITKEKGSCLGSVRTIPKSMEFQHR